MRKIVFASLALLLSMSACAPTQQISKVRTDEVVSNVISLTVADLNVSQQRISFSYKPTAKEMNRASLYESYYIGLQRKVVQQYLLTSDADVIVSPTMVINKDKNGRPTSVTLTGYPAKYTNFRPAEGDEYEGIARFYTEIN